MKRFQAVVLACCFAVTTMTAFGQEQSPQKDDQVLVPKSMLTPGQRMELETKDIEQRIRRYGEWVGLGREVGEAVNDSLKAITSQAVDFSKTGLGKFTMFLVAWKVIGTDLIQAIVGILLFFVWVPLWIWSFRQNALKRRVLKSVAPDKKYEYEVINNDEDAMNERIVHLVAFVGIFVLNLAVIFV